MDEAPTPSRFHITLRGAILALTLAAVWCGVVFGIVAPPRFMALIVIVSLPFATLGGLFGHPWLGLSLGLFFSVPCLLIVLYAVHISAPV